MVVATLKTMFQKFNVFSHLLLSLNYITYKIFFDVKNLFYHSFYFKNTRDSNINKNNEQAFFKTVFFPHVGDANSTKFTKLVLVFSTLFHKNILNSNNFFVYLVKPRLDSTLKQTSFYKDLVFNFTNKFDNNSMYNNFLVGYKST